MRESTTLKKAQAYAVELRKPVAEVELPPEIMAVIPALAVENHKGWMKEKEEQGYVFGKETNDKLENGPLTSPNLVPFDQLDEATKKANEANVIATLKLISGAGGTFVSLTNFLILPLAARIHDEWSRTKILDGWEYAPETNKAEKKHRDLIPFEDLMRLHPEDVVFDIEAAKKAIIKMVCDFDIFVLIKDPDAYAKRAACTPA